MDKLVLIDGNSIMNRAFYGIMGSKMLMTNDGRYTNAVYGFLSILFKILEDIDPKYLVVAFDLKAPTARHKLYEGYKANRHGMPDELAQQMPIIKEVLKAMNIDVIEKEGYEADDVLGTLAKYGEKQGLDVTILSGDRDTFQLASDNITIRIPRTKMGKTETELFDKNKILETYGLEPKQLIEVKGLQGDTSDNIPGVPGIGEKTALTLIQKYKSIENLYEKLEKNEDDLKGKQREKLVENKDLAFLSKTLGTINLEVPIEDNLDNFKVEEWNKKDVLELFKTLNFKRYIERFNLSDDIVSEENKDLKSLFKINDTISMKDVINKVKELGKLVYYIGLEDSQNQEQIIKSNITSISIYNYKEKEVYYIKNRDQDFQNMLKEIFEDETIEKYGYEINYMYIVLKQMGITPKNIKYDVIVASYILNPSDGKYLIDNLCEKYLEINVNEYLLSNGVEEQNAQINLFDTNSLNNEINADKYKQAFYAYSIWNLAEKMTLKLKEINSIDLFNNIDMPTVEVLSDMQWNGMYADKEELDIFGDELKQDLEILTKEIYDLAGVEFNINSTQQLGEILFEKLGLPIFNKNKSGYSTDVDVLEKLRQEHPVIEKVLEYRQLTKLNSTYVEGLIPYINPKTKRIHSFFHQTITATGRISSTEPNLQNIPTRIELGKRLRKVFKPEKRKSVFRCRLFSNRVKSFGTYI